MGTVISLLLALLGFFGFPTLRSMIPRGWSEMVESAWAAGSADFRGVVDWARSATFPWAHGACLPAASAKNDVSGQTWSLQPTDRRIMFDFERDGEVLISDTSLGTGGHWTPFSANGVRIQTSSHLIDGAVVGDGLKMGVDIRRQDHAIQRDTFEHVGMFLERICS